MALVIGHSQTKYLSDYLCHGTYSVFSFPGAKTLEFLGKDVIFEVTPYFSVIYIIVGANDLGIKTPPQVAEEIELLCEKIHYSSPSATIIVSEILPRGQNLFDGCHISQRFLDKWNRNAAEVNVLLRRLASCTSWLNVLPQHDFHTMFGAKRQLLSRDGLHLNIDGHETLASNIENSFRDVVDGQIEQKVEMFHLDVPLISSEKPSNTLVGPLRYSDVVRSSTKESSAVKLGSPTIRVPSTIVPKSTKSSSQMPKDQRPKKKVRLSHHERRKSTCTKKLPLTQTQTDEKRKTKVRFTKKLSLPLAETSETFVVSTCSDILQENKGTSVETVTNSLSPLKRPSTKVSRSKLQKPPSLQSTVRRSRKDKLVLIETSEKFFLSSDVGTSTLYGQSLNTQECQRGGGPSKVFCKRTNPLSTSEVLSIFSECKNGVHDDNLCVTVPSEPVGGDVYVFDTSVLANVKDLRVDKYVWLNDGRKKYPRNKSALLYKTIFKIRLQDKTHSTQFVKHIFEHVEDSKFVLVHYLGDESVYKPLSHGNSKNPSNIFRRTCPSVFDDIKEKAKDITKTATEIEKESKSKVNRGAELGVKTAKNVEQVKNHFYKTRRDSKLSHDSIYNLCAMSYELENFNKQIDVYPSLVCISGYDEILTEFNHLLVYDHKTPIKMFYDTTYELSGLFVSVLSYQHIIFEGNKIIPVAFMLHDKRDTKFHERFFRVIGEHVPNLTKTNSPFICDREPGIKKALNTVFPNIPVLHCWNHLNTDVKMWVKKHNGNQDDIATYANEVKKILFSESEAACLKKIESLEVKWSEAFRTYFHKHIKSAIMENSGQWILQNLNVFDPYSGITNNAAESVNHMIKSVQKHKELPVDYLCLHLFYLQKTIYTDMQCSRAGFGNYKLKDEFSFAKLDPDEIELPKIRGTPAEILEHVKQKIQEIELARINDTEPNSTASDENDSPCKIDLIENINTAEEIKNIDNREQSSDTTLKHILTDICRVKFK